MLALRPSDGKILETTKEVRALLFAAAMLALYLYFLFGNP